MAPELGNLQKQQLHMDEFKDNLGKMAALVLDHGLTSERLLSEQTAASQELAALGQSLLFPGYAFLGAVDMVNELREWANLGGSAQEDLVRKFVDGWHNTHVLRFVPDDVAAENDKTREGWRDFKESLRRSLCFLRKSEMREMAIMDGTATGYHVTTTELVSTMFMTVSLGCDQRGMENVVVSLDVAFLEKVGPGGDILLRRLHEFIEEARLSFSATSANCEETFHALKEFPEGVVQWTTQELHVEGENEWLAHLFH